MSSCHTFRPVPGQCGPRGRGPLPAPPFDPQDYWATRKLVSSLVGALETSKLDRTDVVDPAAATEDGKAADAKRTQEEMDRILGVASGALALAESKADKLSSRQLDAVNSGIDAAKVAKIARNEIAISEEVSRATTEEARLRELVNAIKTFDAVVADSLPDPSEQYSRKLYLVPSTNPETRNVRDEFICVKIGESWSWEQVGSTAVTIEFDDEPTEGSQKAARSGGIWSWVKSLLPKWLTSNYAEPATVESVAKKADSSALTAHTENTDNPHGVTPGQIGALSMSPHPSSDQTFNWSSPSGGDIRLFGDHYGTGIGFGLWSGGGELFNYHDGTYDWYKLPTGKSGTLALQSDVESKADRPALPVTAGNLAALTADGNLSDSGKKASDFAPAVEGGYLPLNGGGTVNGDTTFLGNFRAGPYGDMIVVNRDAGYLYKYDSEGIKWYYGFGDPADEIAVKGDISALSSSVSALESSKADKTIPSKRGNLSALAEDGNLIDSYIDMQDLVLKNQVNWMADIGSGFSSGQGDGFFFTIENGEQRLAVLKGRVIVDRDGKDAGERSVAMLGDISALSSSVSALESSKADRASIAPEYSATSAYSVGSIVYHDGGIYQCKTAIADGGEAWNADHWDLRKLDGFFTESNSLLTSRVNTLIDAKVGNVNAVLAAALDGTEVA